MKKIWFEIMYVIDAASHPSEVPELFMSILKVLGKSCGLLKHGLYSVKFHALKGMLEWLLTAWLLGLVGGVGGETFWHQGSCGPRHGVCRYFGQSLRSLPTQASL